MLLVKFFQWLIFAFCVSVQAWFSPWLISTLDIFVDILAIPPKFIIRSSQGVTKRRRRSWRPRICMNPNAEWGGELRGLSQVSANDSVHRSPNKLWRSNAIFNLWHFLIRTVSKSLPVLSSSSISWRDRHALRNGCTVGYSDFHNLMGFTSKKMPNNIL